MWKIFLLSNILDSEALWIICNFLLSGNSSKFLSSSFPEEIIERYVGRPGLL